jgi:hypothetical protein
MNHSRITADDIRSFVHAQELALQNLQVGDQRKRSRVGTIAEYVDSIRLRTNIDPSRLAYYAYALNELSNVDKRLNPLPPIEFISTLNNCSALIDFGNGPILILDAYQGQTLEEIGQIFFSSTPAPKRACAMGLRLVAEQYLASQQPEHAAHFAGFCSAVINEDPGQLVYDEEECARCASVQEVFLLTHEIGHLLWRQGKIPANFIEMAASWIYADCMLLSSKVEKRDLERFNDGSAPAGVSDLVRQYIKESADNSAYNGKKVDDLIRYRLDPSNGYIEEVWADFYAWTACMRLFFGNWPASTVYSAMSLAIRNLATIEAYRRMAVGEVDPRTVDATSSRRHVLRLGLRTLMGDLRQNDDFCQMTQLSDEELSVDFALIGEEVDDRYDRDVWQPMSIGVATVARAIRSPEYLAQKYSRYEAEYGPNPTFKILDQCRVGARP